MSDTHVPVKTPLGQQELRQRSKALGQRHRTVLLLVDGRRPLAEVLTMAHQAGAMTAHFEDLVRLGMIELPAPPANGLPDPEPEQSTELLVEHRAEPTVEEPELDQAPADAPAVADPFIGSPPDEPAPAARTEPAIEPARPARRKAASAIEPRRATSPNSLPPLPKAPLDAVPEPVAPDLPPTEAHKLEEVRRLLSDILRRDTLLHRLFAPARVRGARTQEALVALVWEIERERAHAQRKRVQLIALQRARELLGMGNTLVAEDTLPFEPTRP